MKIKITVIAAAVLLLGILAGCGTAARQIQIKAHGEKTDIFTEIENGGAVPNGFADLIIKANIKTHVEGYYIGESRESLHGKPAYPFLINIDGHVRTWKAEGMKDSKPAHAEDGKTSRDPEAGEGVKYVLEKKVRLQAGTHKVFFGLHEDNYFTEVEISLGEGEANTLEFKPIYRTKRIPARIPTFLKGIDRFEAFLNGAPLR